MDCAECHRNTNRERTHRRHSSPSRGPRVLSNETERGYVPRAKSVNGKPGRKERLKRPMTGPFVTCRSVLSSTLFLCVLPRETHLRYSGLCSSGKFYLLHQRGYIESLILNLHFFIYRIYR